MFVQRTQIISVKSHTYCEHTTARVLFLAKKHVSPSGSFIGLETMYVEIYSFAYFAGFVSLEGKYSLSAWRPSPGFQCKELTILTGAIFSNTRNRPRDDFCRVILVRECHLSLCNLDVAYLNDAALVVHVFDFKPLWR